MSWQIKTVSLQCDCCWTILVKWQTKRGQHHLVCPSWRSNLQTMLQICYQTWGVVLIITSETWRYSTLMVYRMSCVSTTSTSTSSAMLILLRHFESTLVFYIKNYLMPTSDSRTHPACDGACWTKPCDLSGFETNPNFLRVFKIIYIFFTYNLAICQIRIVTTKLA